MPRRRRVAFRRIKVEGTLWLARSAAEAGIQRFVFLSSVKVLGEATPDRPFTDSSPPDPRDPYDVSKWEAEQALSEIAGRFKMGVVILRPPLVYGPGDKGNFRSLMRFVDRGVPLPLGSIANRRSLLCLGNLVDAIERCLAHRAAAGRTDLIRDGEDRPIADLVRRLAASLGRKAPLFSVPEAVLKLAAGCLGRKAEAGRLLSSPTVDDRPLRVELGWEPPFTVNQGLTETAKWCRERADH